MKIRTEILIGLLIFIISCDTGTGKKSNIRKDDSQENVKTDNRKLAFQNNEFISCYDFSTGETKNLTEGFDPCISPDGEWIVFTQSSSVGDNFSRTIKLINTENSTIKDLEINNNNHYGAIWSPTGEHLAFSIMTDDWQIGLIKPNGTELKIISTRFCFTTDNKKMVFDGGIDEFIEGLNEPLCAIFCYDFNTKSTKRISKKGLYAMDLWMDNQDRIYFSGFENINEPGKIYQTSLTDTTLIELIEGTRPSMGG